MVFGCHLQCSLLAFIPYSLVFHVCELQSATFSVKGPPDPVAMAVGQDVVLPCHVSPAQSVQDMEVTWFREQFTPFVHRYKERQDQYGDQMVQYQGRTELLKDGLTNGSVDLRIFRVQLSDKGLYTCFVRSGSEYDEAVVELKVTASGSAPRIVLEHYQDGGIRVACRSGGWFPQPQVLWQDHCGQHLPSLSENITQDESGLFAMESILILTRSASQEVACVVRPALQSQEKESSFYISDPFFQNAHPWKIGLGVVLVAVLSLFIIAVYLFRRKGQHEKQCKQQHCGTVLLKLGFALLGSAEVQPPAQADGCRRGDIQADIPQPICDDLHAFCFAERQAEELEWRRYAVPIENVAVVLDSDTAHCDLVLSDDCKSVKREDKLQNVPSLPQRFDPWRCVLGCEGYTSGRYYWEVEVVDGGGWAVGVSREDVKRKGEIQFSPEEGIWAVGNWAGKFKAFTSPEHTLLHESQAPTRVRVSLDYEVGRVTFFSVDEKNSIFTFPLASFDGFRVHPWVWLGPGTWLKMCP
ncbi:butyrophilin subfamily 1 member A1-like [Aythya fuligula]|uniref:Butyrophilin subfamily 1 member A1-like n=1 Tax=Aythya fuligula TaxID=219594 RepID=A0A6J3ED51_AYTFU|nr:butyrophilin subfamily 1 member A1-like [Aythya fuligula]